MKLFVFLLLLFAQSVAVRAVNLEDAPDDDLGEIERAKEEMLAKFVTPVTFTTSTGKPKLDGVLDDAFWSQAQSLDIKMELFPERFAKPIVDTNVLVAITATHLYLGYTAYDPEPDKIRSAYRERDGTKDEDYVSIIIDPAGNLRRKFEFRVNPNGVLSDVLQNPVSNRYIYDWDTRWEAAANKTSAGYVVEMEIPLDSIKHPRIREGEVQKWVVILKRTYPRAVDRTFGSVFVFEKEDSISRVTKKRQLEIIPYYIYHPDEERDHDESFKQIKKAENHDAGIDLKLIIDSATTLSATINPNYTEVEADIARDSINNSFTPFQPEKRAFFQDSVDLYSTLMPVVYTRNIFQPKYGLNFTDGGKKNALGGLIVGDERTKLIMPDNLGSDKVEIDESGELMALRWVSAEKGSATGLLGTVRTGKDYSNYVGGVDGIYNFGIDDKLRYQLMYSRTEYPETFADDLCDGDDCLVNPSPDDCFIGDCSINAYVLRADPNSTLSGHGVRLGYKHDSPESIYWLNYYDYAADFRADFGFDKRTDYRLVNAAYGKNWFVNTLRRDKGKSRIRAYLVGNHLESSQGETIENGIDLWGEFRGSFQTVFRIGRRFKERAVNRIQQDTLALGDNAPLFDESYWQWYYEVSPHSSFAVNLDGRYGDIADADNLLLGQMVELKPRLRIYMGKFKLQLSHTYRDFDSEGSTLYRENFSTIQAGLHLDNQQVIRLLVLFDKTDFDADRYLGEDLTFEKEKTLEFTYLNRRNSGFSILTGMKLVLEDDNSLEEQFTSEREFYFKVRYDFNKDIELAIEDR